MAVLWAAKPVLAFRLSLNLYHMSAMALWRHSRQAPVVGSNYTPTNTHTPMAGYAIGNERLYAGAPSPNPTRRTNPKRLIFVYPLRATILVNSVNLLANPNSTVNSIS